MTNLNFNHIFNACILCILKSYLYHRNKCIVFSGLLDSGMLTFMIIYLINYCTNICFLPFIFSSKQGGRGGGLGGRIQGQRAVLVICGEGTQLGLWLCYLCSQGISTEQPGLCPSYREQWGGGRSAGMGGSARPRCQGVVTPPHWLGLTLVPSPQFISSLLSHQTITNLGNMGSDFILWCRSSLF